MFKWNDRKQFYLSGRQDSYLTIDSDAAGSADLAAFFKVNTLQVASSGKKS